MGQRSNLLSIGEDYRGNLLIHSHEKQQFPYLVLAVSVASASAGRVVHLKVLLVRILSSGGQADLDGADATQFPLPEDRMIKGIQPSAQSQNAVNSCVNCQTKEKAIIDWVLGLTHLKNKTQEGHVSSCPKDSRAACLQYKLISSGEKAMNSSP
ncbi:hypothetical protein BDV93DRAFT_549110 [Ceratobasidium sp. AG-I]|nr:hypothetical protein BDV93DRAFT_549110 [Ceratobasidium sp. AG-I]